MQEQTFHQHFLYQLLIVFPNEVWHPLADLTDTHIKHQYHIKHMHIHHQLLRLLNMLSQTKNNNSPSFHKSLFLHNLKQNFLNILHSFPHSSKGSHYQDNIPKQFENIPLLFHTSFYLDISIPKFCATFQLEHFSLQHHLHLLNIR